MGGSLEQLNQGLDIRSERLGSGMELGARGAGDDPLPPGHAVEPARQLRRGHHRSRLAAADGDERAGRPDARHAPRASPAADGQRRLGDRSTAGRASRCWRRRHERRRCTRRRCGCSGCPIRFRPATSSLPPARTATSEDAIRQIRHRRISTRAAGPAGGSGADPGRTSGFPRHGGLPGATRRSAAHRDGRERRGRPGGERDVRPGLASGQSTERRRRSSGRTCCSAESTCRRGATWWR